MRSMFKIALRNLLRYKRRTILTSLLIVLGVTMVLLFSGLAGSFKAMMVGIITDSTLGHLQIHRKGYVASIDSLPLNLNMSAKGYEQLAGVLDKDPDVAAYAPRIKLGAMLSNYAETTNVRVTAVDPSKETVVCPALPDRLLDKSVLVAAPLVSPGEIVIPQRVAAAMGVKAGDSVVLIATNKDGSVNGMPFTVGNLIEDVAGPSGKDAYLHIEDARELLRIDSAEVSEVVIRVKDFGSLDKIAGRINMQIQQFTNKQGKPAFEAHTWAKLSPFANIAGMIDLMIVTVKIIMIAIVLISVLNVMLMSVFERVREIGTIAAMGTTPGKILGLFVVEGFVLGLLGAAVGSALGLAGLLAVKYANITFSFARMDNLALRPTIDIGEFLAIAIIVLAASTLAALQPAWKASRMEPVEALGHV
ncbi:ABC transporter permease [Desulfocurvibacter africanus]|uniref:ABC transporter permease n=1 Tax=Desulfocurvibacter africanus TaxID=873 RepID=UPI00042478C5|nr:FtsX-like permease family protein [Desulfocurvibacter africanus]